MNKRSTNSLRTDFLVVAVIVLGFAIGMAVFLNYFKYQKAFGNLIQGRMMYVADDVKADVEHSLSLGLSLSNINTLSSFMSRERVTDSLIDSIGVADENGRILYSTDPTRIGIKVDPEWMKFVKAPKALHWSAAEPTEYVFGAVIRNNFDLPVGTVVLRYSRAYVDRNVQAMGVTLIKFSALVFAGFALIGVVVLMWLFRALHSDLKEVEVPLQVLVDDPMATVPAAAESHVARFGANVREAAQAIAEVEETLGAGRAGV